jgi:hypothetical protein
MKWTLQTGTGSSDIVMGYELTAFLASFRPRLSWTPTPTGITFTWPDAFYTLQRSGTVQFTNPINLGTNKTATPTTFDQAQSFFRLVKTN